MPSFSRPASAVRPEQHRYVDMRMYMLGNDALRAGMHFGETGPIRPLFGDFLGPSTTERSRMTNCLRVGFIELVTEDLTLGHQIGDPRLQHGDASPKGLVLLTELFDRRES
jgi:hypothetical protein